MANYNQRGSNIELVQFMREGHLNSVSTNEPQEDFSGLDNPECLDLFTNQDFFDFDEGIRRDFKPSNDAAPSSKPIEPTSATSMVGEFGSMDFGLGSGRSSLFFFLLLNSNIRSAAPWLCFLLRTWLDADPRLCLVH